MFYFVKKDCFIFDGLSILPFSKTMRFDIQGEISAYKSTIDAVLKESDFVVITEIKYDIKNKSKR